MVSFFNFLIRWSFYLLFIFVPIIFAGNTSELFEFNKMWVTFGLTLIIATSWISLMIIKRQVKIIRTSLDIPILLFLLSQVLATFFSLDFHTSLWGYYSRFNGGLYSLLSYALLYFAFVSNIQRKDVMKYIYTGIGSAVLVAFWGLPSHFGYDPTCLLFRGNLDVSCWTAAFQPKVRIFSTLGQPDWLAAYLVYMLPLTVALGLIFHKAKQQFLSYIFLGLTVLFYADLLFTKARSGFIALLVSLGVFLIIYIAYEWRSFAKHNIFKAAKKHTFFLLTIGTFVVLTFLIGAPLSQLDKFSLSGLQSFIAAKNTVQEIKKQTNPVQTTAIPVQELGGTDSGKIRLFVWQGAWDAFLHNPLFGTGVETFAYAYYQYRPAGHNLTSEWDYLYNKAHNEFLNYLATTGIFGFTTYLFLLFVSIYIVAKWLGENKKLPQEEYKNFAILNSPLSQRTLLVAFLAAYVSILVTNFFGFSVVIMNIYLFLTPAFALLVMNKAKEEHALMLPESESKTDKVSEVGWIGIGVVWLISLYLLIVLLRFWLADTSYAFGQNLDHANQYSAAYSYLHDAVATRPSEPAFQDELAINDAVLSVALNQQKDATNASKLAQEAVAVSNNLVAQHPHIITYWKSRVRIFYSLSQENPQYLAEALSSIEKAAALAPTDAKVWYNLGLLYDQTGNLDKAVTTLERTIKLKPDYREAYYALGIFYRQQALGGDATSKTVKDPIAEKKAINVMHFILNNFGPNDDLKIRDTLKAWGEQ